jgi:virulence-associated protein VagC
MAQASSHGTQAPSGETDAARLVEQSHGDYNVFRDGNSRSFTIPAKVNIGKDEMLRMRKGKCGEQTVYLKAIPESVAPSEVNPESTLDDVREEQVQNQGKTHWVVRECSKGQKISTVPSCFGWDCFGEDSEQILISGWVGGETRYLMVIPVRFWTGPEGVAGGLEPPN